MDIEYKGYKIVKSDGYGFREIKPTGRGSIHLELRGKFTNTTIAKQAIDNHLNGKKVNEDVSTD